MVTAGHRRTVAIIGISSQIAPSLVSALRVAGCDVMGYSRTANTIADCPVRVFGTSDAETIPPLPVVDTLISLAPLPAIERVLDLARRLRASRLIAFGSTGVFSKASSASAVEREFVRDQLAAERLLAERCEAYGMAWTLFRPTMIYGAGNDQNVSFIRSILRRFHAIPIPAGARGLRQPVHVADLADACVRCLDRESTFNRAYNLGGGEVISYGEMVQRICAADGRAARLLPIPAVLYRWLVRGARRFPGLSYLQETMVDRMFADLVTDHADAVRDFGFSPRGFEPPGESQHSA